MDSACMHGWMGGRMDGWMDGWKDGWMDGYRYARHTLMKAFSDFLGM